MVYVVLHAVACFNRSRIRIRRIDLRRAALAPWLLRSHESQDNWQANQMDGNIHPKIERDHICVKKKLAYVDYLGIVTYDTAFWTKWQK